MKQARKQTAEESLLQSKRELFYDEYQKLQQMPGWNADHELLACEKAFARFCDAAHAVLFCSEELALATLLEALDLSIYDRLYLPDNLPSPRFTAATHTQAKQQVMPTDLVTRTLDLPSLKPYLSRQMTRGRDVIIASHRAGSPFPLFELEQLICDPNAFLIEDAVESCGGKELADAKIGSCRASNATLFGFASGSLLDVGGGGAITTRDPKLDQRLRELRGRGNTALSTSQTLLLHAQLQQEEFLIAKRLEERKLALLRYATALQEAFTGRMRNLQPQIVDGLLDARAAPSMVLLRMDLVSFSKHQKQVIALFDKHGLSADWAASLYPVSQLGGMQEEPRPSSCFTSLKLPLSLTLTSGQLLNIFQGLRNILQG